LPYIDEHARAIGATRECAWGALIATMRGLGRTVPAALAGPWGLDPARAQGDWSATPQVGDCLPGFVVERSRPPAELALRGRHRFSRYALVFELDETAATGCTLRAKSYAEFPGLKGRAYRALVIGSGGHRVMVRRMLREIAERA
jgi:hypothetical protein